MKRIILSALCLIAAMTASAQQFMRIWQAGDDVRVALQDITYSADGTFLLADGKQYSLASVDSITMVHVITVTYNGDNATVDIGKAPMCHTSWRPSCREPAPMALSLTQDR